MRNMWDVEVKDLKTVIGELKTDNSSDAKMIVTAINKMWDGEITPQQVIDWIQPVINRVGSSAHEGACDVYTCITSTTSASF